MGFIEVIHERDVYSVEMVHGTYVELYRWFRERYRVCRD